MLVKGSVSADTDGGITIEIDAEHVTVSGQGFQPETRGYFRVVYHYDTENQAELAISGNDLADAEGVVTTGQLPRTILPYPLLDVSAEISDAKIG